MKRYQQYMDRQQGSSALHSRLLALETTHPSPAAKSGFRWQTAALLAACLCLVLGLSWRSLFPFASTGAGAADSAANSSAQTTEDSSQTPEAAGDTADGGLLDGGSLTTEESAPEAGMAAGAVQEAAPAEDTAGELPAQESIAEAEEAEATLFPLPAWLPEGYLLTLSQAWDDASQASYTWSDGSEAQITLTYSLSPLESDWPSYLWSEANWMTLSQLPAQEDTWGFCLQREDLWLECITTGEPEELWQVVQSIPF